MPDLRQVQGEPAKTRPSRPNLTLDTHYPVYPMANGPSAQSAPVGTRQEQGMAPMYQAGDRHCAKLAEMMSSPTWRSQDPDHHIGYYHVQQPQPSSEEGVQSTYYRKENATHSLRAPDLLVQRSYNSRSMGEVLHLGRRSDDIKILDMQPFSEIPEASNNAFIISAAISRDSLHPYETSPGDTFGDDDPNEHEDSVHGSSAFANSPSETETIRQENVQNLEDNAQKAMERDGAIQSINHNLRSPNRRRHVTSDEQQRFRGLLDRLHQTDHQQESRKDATFIDPAIVAFVPKKADQGTPTKRSTRNRSDSGYDASPSIYSRPSTRARSSIERQGFDGSDSEVIHVEHQKFWSQDSGFDESPSKNSILNPTAREFSAPSNSKKFPGKQALLARPPVSKKVFVPSQQFQDMLGSISGPQLGPSTQGAWYPPQTNMTNPLVDFTPMQQGAMPGTLPQWNNIAGSGMPPVAGLNHAGLPPFSGPTPSFGQAHAFDRAGLTTSHGLGAANVSGPFHQQLSGLGLCCDPSHQAITAFSPPSLSNRVMPVMAPQLPGTSVPLAGLTPSAAPFIPKHVPKPKVPNTTGQQNWELVHELRRMNEPGYAQKCKEKQKKRYMKQLEKTGGQY